MIPSVVYSTNLLRGSTSFNTGLREEDDTYPARSDRLGMQLFPGGDLTQETPRSEV